MNYENKRMQPDLAVARLLIRGVMHKGKSIMKNNDEHIEFPEDKPTEYSPRTQPQLQHPGPPRSPSLPRAVATADQDPKRTLILDKSPSLRWANTRCVLSRMLKNVGASGLSSSISPRDLINLKGPFQAAAGSTVAISWKGYRAGIISVWIPKDVSVSEFECRLLKILRIDKKLAIVPSQDTAGHSIVPAISCK